MPPFIRAIGTYAFFYYNRKKCQTKAKKVYNIEKIQKMFYYRHNFWKEGQ